jgi:hypothetical protein
MQFMYSLPSLSGGMSSPWRQRSCSFAKPHVKFVETLHAGAELLFGHAFLWVKAGTSRVYRLERSRGKRSRHDGRSTIS